MKACRSILLALLLAVVSAAWADVNRQQAAQIAQRETGGGRVLAVERMEAGGQGVWRVKVLTRDGSIRVVLIDASSGRPG